MIKLERKTGSVESRAGSGRKRVSTKSNDRYLKCLSLRNSHESASDLKVRFKTEFYVNLSTHSLQMKLAKCRLNAYHPKEKSLLKKK